MAQLILPQQYDEQPQEAAEVDWSNPLARGLTLLWSPMVGRGSNAVTGQTPIEVGAGSISPTEKGLTYISQAGVANGLSFGLYKAIPTGSNTYTILCLAKPVAGTGNRQVLFVQGDNAGAPYTQYRLGVNSGETAYSSGRFAIQEYDNALLPSAASPATAVDGNWHVFAGKREGSVSTVYLDGKDATTARTSVATVSNATAGTLHLSGSNAASETYVSPNALVAVWSRALTDTEIAAVSDNPWQLFEAPPLILSTAAAGAPGATIISLTTASLGFTARSPQVRVASTLSAASMSTSAKPIQSRLSTSLSTASLPMSAKPIQLSVAARMTTATMSTIAQAITLGRNTVIQLTAATLAYSAKVLTITGVAGILRRALILRAGRKAQISDAELGTGLKPIVLTGDRLKIQSVSEGKPVVIIDERLQQKPDSDTLQI